MDPTQPTPSQSHNSLPESEPYPTSLSQQISSRNVAEGGLPVTPPAIPIPDVIDFATMGMFIIDRIQLPNGDIVDDIPGGAGLFAHIGARILTPPPASYQLLMIVHLGNDFPAQLLARLRSLQTCLLEIPTPWRQTTRGENVYVESPGRNPTSNPGFNGAQGGASGAGEGKEKENEKNLRLFRYLTPKLRIEASDLPFATPTQQHHRTIHSLHLICSPTRAFHSINSLPTPAATKTTPSFRRPTIIWEPVPDAISPSEVLLTQTLLGLGMVDVFSPNEEELARFLPEDRKGLGVEENVRKVLEGVEFLTADQGGGAEGGLSIIIRCGARGCYVTSPSPSSSAHQNTGTWLPPYHTTPHHIIDPTGAGNAFLGGVAVGMQRHAWDPIWGAMYGSVAAGYVVEQVGIPEVTGEYRGWEEWNGEDVRERLKGYVEKIRGEVEGLSGFGVGHQDKVLGVEF